MTEWTNAFKKGPDLGKVAEAAKDRAKSQAERKLNSSARSAGQKAKQQVRTKASEAIEDLTDGHDSGHKPESTSAPTSNGSEGQLTTVATAPPATRSENQATPTAPVVVGEPPPPVAHAVKQTEEPRRPTKLVVGLGLIAVALVAALVVVFFSLGRGSEVSVIAASSEGIEGSGSPNALDSETTQGPPTQSSVAELAARPTPNSSPPDTEATDSAAVVVNTSSSEVVADRSEDAEADSTCGPRSVEKWVANSFAGCVDTEPCADEYGTYSVRPPQRCEYAAASDECPIGYVWDGSGADPSCRANPCKYPLLTGDGNYCIQRWRCVEDGGSIVDNSRCPGAGRPAEFAGLYDLEHVLFADGEASIDGSAVNVLADAVLVANSFRDGLAILVVGHADRSEPASIAQSRVDAVAAYLVAQGVPENQIVTRSAGSEYPVVDPATTDADRALNRRVIFNYEWLRQE